MNLYTAESERNDVMIEWWTRGSLPILDTTAMEKPNKQRKAMFSGQWNKAHNERGKHVGLRVPTAVKTSLRRDIRC